MYRLLLLTLALGGCAATGYEADDEDSAFHKAAVSWVGAPVEEMIGRWGEPNNLHVEASDDRDGLARWRAINITSGSSPTAGIGSASHSYRCIAEARYDMHGVITKVDTVSSQCEKLARLTR
jgi:hypothetical protein